MFHLFFKNVVQCTQELPFKNKQGAVATSLRNSCQNIKYQGAVVSANEGKDTEPVQRNEENETLQLQFISLHVRYPCTAPSSVYFLLRLSCLIVENYEMTSPLL